MTNPTYDVSASSCTGASDQMLRTIQHHLSAAGTLRNGKLVPAGDHTFVSAELHLRSDDKHAQGDILTWVTTNIGSNEFSSVDVHAREESSWPPSDLDVRADGARESRACTALNAGKTKAQLECEQGQQSGNSPSVANKNCGDL